MVQHILRDSRVRRVFALVAAGVLGLTTVVAPASAQSTPSAGGTCGPAPGAYGQTGVGADQYGGANETVPAVYYRIDYNVASPTMIGVILRRDDDLGTGGLLTVFSSNGTGGTYEGAWRADIRPENQGWQNSVGPTIGRADGPTTSQRSRGGAAQSFYTSGGIQPGGWYFYVYTGEARYNEARGYHFVVDEKGFLGEFVCNVSDDDGKN